jgi:thiol-disulfide isomerase/thioredoxin
MKKTVILSIVGIVVVIAVIVYAIVSESKKPGEYDEFATCIAGSGATFFGAFWCPHCLDQKRDFGRSAKLLPYEVAKHRSNQNGLSQNGYGHFFFLLKVCTREIRPMPQTIAK